MVDPISIMNKKIINNKLPTRAAMLASVISELRKHQASRVESIARRRVKDASRFNEIYHNLKPLYDSSIERVKHEIGSHIKDIERLYTPTIFEIMKMHTSEESHSNVIAWFLQNPTTGKCILNQIFKYIELIHPALVIANDGYGNYSVTREKFLGGKRLDIFVEGRSWVLAIENKFRDRVRMVDENRSQTDHYRDEIVEKYSYKTKIFILLDYKGEEQSDDYIPFDYYDLLKVFETVKNENPLLLHDNIFSEYLYLLRRLSMGLEGSTKYDSLGSNNLSLLNHVYSEAIRWN